MGTVDKLRAANRARKWKLFEETVPFDDTSTVLDVGFSDREYSPVDNYLEKHYPYPEHLTALGVDEPREFLQRYPAVHAVRYDGSLFPFEDKSFDICWSNAVIEHVGDWKRQVLFLKETFRVSERAFFTTPNRLFPVELHTRTPLLHYLPKATFDAYLRRRGKAWAAGDYMHLLSAGQLRSLLSEAGCTDYRLYKNRLAGLAVDFVVVVDRCP